MRSRWAWPAARCAAVGVGLALALGGCGGSALPTPKRVIAAMTAEPRMVVDLTGTSIRRAVIDTRAQYLALFSQTALLLLERDGREYHQADGCYRVAPGGHLTTQSFWAGTVDDVTGGAHSTKASGDSVIYRSSGGELVVDSRTDLVRSTRFAGFASGGVAATTATFLYPRSVTELAAPRRLCH